MFEERLVSEHGSRNRISTKTVVVSLTHTTPVLYRFILGSCLFTMLKVQNHLILGIHGCRWKEGYKNVIKIVSIAVRHM